MRIVSASLLGLMITTTLGACSKDKGPPLTPASGEVPTKGDAVHAIATAECDREERCNRIGSDKQFASREHCMDKMSRELRSKLSACADRVDEGDVRQCTGSIRNQGCSGAFNSFERFVACSMDDLCD